MDLDEYNFGTCMIPYDPKYAKERLAILNGHQPTPTIARERELNTSLPASMPSDWKPPDWKGCRLNIYCVRKCEDGMHCKPDGTSGGRGPCKIRPPPDDYCPPVGTPAYSVSSTTKRKREDMSPSPVTEDDCSKGAGRTSGRTSEMETLRTAVEHLREDNSQLWANINSLSKAVTDLTDMVEILMAREARVRAAYMPPRH